MRLFFKLTLQYVPIDDQFETPQSLEGFGRSSKTDYSSCVDVYDLVLYLSRVLLQYYYFEVSSKLSVCVVLFTVHST